MTGKRKQAKALLCLPLLGLCPGVLADIEQKPLLPADIRGVDPAFYDRYTPGASNNFTCLDGSNVFPWSAINDDFCDCPDGSDEPGTSACHNGFFYCKNEGHIPGKVLSSRVNDGLCDPECCDGTDEWFTGACPNRCAEIGKAHKAKLEAEAKIRKTGSKIRGTYIKWAQAEKNRLQMELEGKKAEVEAKEREVEVARGKLEAAEARSKEDLDKKKQSPLYTSLLTHRLALTRLRSRTARLEAELASLHGIMDELSKGYNPNYQDMAVKEAVVGYQEVTKPTTPPEGVEGEEEIEDRELDELERKDLEGLLLSDIGEGAEEDEAEVGGLLWKIDEYIPDSLYESWETVRDTAIEWMIRVGFLGKGSKGAAKGSGIDGPHVATARQAHTDATNALNRLNNDIRSTEETLGKMTNHYGPENEWKKLDGTCIDTIAGDYTYEVCFFGRATQKSNKDSSSNHLGTFEAWREEAAVNPGMYEYYTKQQYRNGARCWNGPLRSVTLDLSCGTKNEILSVSEPEKCEYFFKVTTPALCWPAEELAQAKQKVVIKEEL